MNSTGNDIVSLNAIDISRTLQPRFYSKILCAAEIASYYEAGLTRLPFERYVWLLWSIKESAYKYLQRHNPELVFSPTRFIVTQLEIPALPASPITEGSGLASTSAYKATVTYRQAILYSRSLINNNFIFSVVNHENGFENIHWGIKSIKDTTPDRQSAEVRSLLVNTLKELMPYSNFSVIKNHHGCPLATNGDRVSDIPVSLAHHDHYIAYSFQLEQIPASF